MKRITLGLLAAILLAVAAQPALAACFWWMEPCNIDCGWWCW